MPSATKRRAVGIALLLLATWPLVHYQLVQRYDLDPWKFAGWAMYTRPSFLPAVDVFELRDGERVKVPLIGSRLEAAGREQERLREAALYWGQWVDPDELARRARHGLATSEPIEIVITRYFIDSESDRTSASRRSYLYAADGSAPEVW